MRSRVWPRGEGMEWVVALEGIQEGEGVWSGMANSRVRSSGEAVGS